MKSDRQLNADRNRKAAEIVNPMLRILYPNCPNTRNPTSDPEHLSPKA